jgi:hypothetical protein
VRDAYEGNKLKWHTMVFCGGEMRNSQKYEHSEGRK